MRSSLRMSRLPRRAVRQVGPPRRCYQLTPSPIELPVVAFAVTILAGPTAERGIEAVVPQPHLRVERHAPRHHATARAGAFLPIVHVVLLEGARRAEAAHSGQADRLLDVIWRCLVDEHPRPDLGPAGTARMPDAEGSRGRAQQ